MLFRGRDPGNKTNLIIWIKVPRNSRIIFGAKGWALRAARVLGVELTFQLLSFFTGTSNKSVAQPWGPRDLSPVNPISYHRVTYILSKKRKRKIWTIVFVSCLLQQFIFSRLLHFCPKMSLLLGTVSDYLCFELTRRTLISFSQCRDFVVKILY